MFYLFTESNNFFAELMVELHESIVAIGRHFMSSDQNYTAISLDPDFSLESHSKDHERFTLGFTSGFKRAKALVGELIF